MAASLLAGLAAGAGVGLAQGTLGAAVQYHNQKQLNAQAQRNFERNLALQQRLHQKMQFAEVANSTAALRAAGLSPVLATGSTPTAPSPSAPMQSSTAAMPQFDIAGSIESVGAASLLASQQKNIDSSTELNKAIAEKALAEAGKTPEEIKLLKAQTAEKQLFNQVLADKNAMAADLLTNHFKSAAEHSSSYAERDFNEAMAEKAPKMSVGSLIALTDFYGAMNSVKDFERNDVYTQLYKIIKRLQLDSDSVLYSLAHMDEAEFKKAMAQTNDLLESRKLKQVEREVLIPAQADLLGEQAETEISKRSLMASQEDLARTQEKAIPQTLRMEHHKNFIDMVDDGEYGKAALSQLPLLINGLENFLLFRYLGKGTNYSPKTIEQTLKGSNGSRSGLPSKVWRSIQDKADKIKDPVQRAQYIDKAVRSYNMSY